jgi:DNA-binding transcriptional ArsR family regulator
MGPDTLARLKTLTDATRLRIVGRLGAGPATTEQLVEELRLPLPVVVRHLSLLRRRELVDGSGEPAAWALRLGALQAMGRELDALGRSTEADSPTGADGQPLAAQDAKVLRAFVEHGRLTTIPAQQRKRLVLLHWLRDQVFTEDRDYPEPEVNQRLALFHPDVASLRRYMVDEKLVSRENRIYRRES